LKNLISDFVNEVLTKWISRYIIINIERE
jgi:hypothetical protein